MFPHFAYATTSVVHWFSGWKFTGNFTTVDLIAASTNALNGALLARRPDHYKNFTVIGVMGMALLMGLGKDSPADLGQAQVSPGVVNYDDTVVSERILATADLYYIYMH